MWSGHRRRKCDSPSARRFGLQLVVIGLDVTMGRTTPTPRSSMAAAVPRLSVCLTFDFDAMSSWVQDSDNPAEISRGEFGAMAVPRILDLLDRHVIDATFFIPGH